MARSPPEEIVLTEGQGFVTVQPEPKPMHTESQAAAPGAPKTSAPPVRSDPPRAATTSGTAINDSATDAKGVAKMPEWLSTLLKWAAISIAVVFGVMFTITSGIPLLIEQTAGLVCKISKHVVSTNLGCATEAGFRSDREAEMSAIVARPRTPAVSAPPPVFVGQTVPAARQWQAHSVPPPMRGMGPSVDCAARGGHRMINPSTGVPSCWVPNR